MHRPRPHCHCSQNRYRCRYNGSMRQWQYPGVPGTTVKSLPARSGTTNLTLSPHSGSKESIGLILPEESRSDLARAFPRPWHPRTDSRHLFDQTIRRWFPIRWLLGQSALRALYWPKCPIAVDSSVMHGTFRSKKFFRREGKRARHRAPRTLHQHVWSWSGSDRRFVDRELQA